MEQLLASAWRHSLAHISIDDQRQGWALSNVTEQTHKQPLSNPQNIVLVDKTLDTLYHIRGLLEAYIPTFQTSLDLQGSDTTADPRLFNGLFRVNTTASFNVSAANLEPAAAYYANGRDALGLYSFFDSWKVATARNPKVSEALDSAFKGTKALLGLIEKQYLILIKLWDLSNSEALLINLNSLNVQQILLSYWQLYDKLSNRWLPSSKLKKNDIQYGSHIIKFGSTYQHFVQQPSVPETRRDIYRQRRGGEGESYELQTYEDEGGGEFGGVEVDTPEPWKNVWQTETGGNIPIPATRTFDLQMQALIIAQKNQSKLMKRLFQIAKEQEKFAPTTAITENPKIREIRANLYDLSGRAQAMGQESFSADFYRRGNLLVGQFDKTMARYRALLAFTKKASLPTVITGEALSEEQLSTEGEGESEYEEEEEQPKAEAHRKAQKMHNDAKLKLHASMVPPRLNVAATIETASILVPGPDAIIMPNLNLSSYKPSVHCSKEPNWVPMIPALSYGESYEERESTLAARFRAENEELQLRIRDLQKVITQNAAELDASQARLQEVLAQHAGGHVEISGTTTEDIERLRTEVRDKTTTNDGLVAQLATLQTTQVNLSANHQECLTELNAVRAALHQKDSNIVSLESYILTANSAIERLEAVIKQREEAAQQAKTYNEGLQTQLQDITGRLQEAQLELNTIKASQSTTSSAQATIIDELVTSRTTQLQTRVTELQHNLQQLNQEHTRSSAELANVQQQLENATTQIEQLTSERQRLSSEKDSQSEQLVQVQHAQAEILARVQAQTRFYSQLLNELAPIFATHDVDFNGASSLAAFEEAGISSSSSLVKEAVDAVLAKLDAEIANLRQTNTTLQTNNRTMLADTVHAESLSARISAEKITIETERDNLQRQLVSLQADNDALRAQPSGVDMIPRADYDRIAAESRQQNTQITALERTNRQLQEELTRTTTQHTATTRAAQESHRVLNAQLQEKTTEAATLADNYRQLDARYQALVAEHHTSTTLLRDSEATNERHASELAAVTQQKDDLQGLLDETNQQIAQMQSDLLQNATSITTQQTTLQERQRRIDELQSRVTRAETTAAETHTTMQLQNTRQAETIRELESRIAQLPQLQAGSIERVSQLLKAMIESLEHLTNFEAIPNFMQMPLKDVSTAFLMRMNAVRPYLQDVYPAELELTKELETDLRKLVSLGLEAAIIKFIDWYIEKTAQLAVGNDTSFIADLMQMIADMNVDDATRERVYRYINALTDETNKPESSSSSSSGSSSSSSSSSTPVLTPTLSSTSISESSSPMTSPSVEEALPAEEIPEVSQPQAKPPAKTRTKVAVTETSTSSSSSQPSRRASSRVARNLVYIPEYQEGLTTLSKTTYNLWRNKFLTSKTIKSQTLDFTGDSDTNATSILFLHPTSFTAVGPIPEKYSKTYAILPSKRAMPGFEKTLNIPDGTTATTIETSYAVNIKKLLQ